MTSEKTRTYLDIYFVELIRTIHTDIKIYIGRINLKYLILAEQATIDIFNEIVEEYFGKNKSLSFPVHKFNTVDKVVNAIERRNISITNRIVDSEVDKVINNKIKKYFSIFTLKTQNDTSVFEKIAFADQRPDIADDNKEKNTAIEDVVFKALALHLDDNEKIQKRESDIIKNILRKGKYTDMFIKPSSDYVYRGMHIEQDIADKLKGKSNFVFIPKGGQSSSWTSDENIARNFSKYYGYVGVVLKASTHTNNNKLLDLANLYSIRGLREFRDEREIIGLGPIDVESLSVIEHKFVR